MRMAAARVSRHEAKGTRRLSNVGFLETAAGVGYPEDSYMSGSKTNPGFFGGSEPPPPASKSDEDASPRAARTVIGHELHLRSPPVLRPAADLPPPRVETSAGVPEAVTDETTEELPARPRHSGKSKFPALARLFGRWTTGGGFLSRSRMSGGDDDLPSVPRDAWASRVAIFVVAALFSFLVALAVLKLQRCSETGSGPAAATKVSVSPAPLAAPASNAAQAVLPAPSAPPVPLANASHPLAAAAPAAPVAQPQAVLPKSHRRAKRPGASSVRAAPAAAGKPRAQRTQIEPPMPSTENRDSLLPISM
jgi:hypothetical protein